MKTPLIDTGNRIMFSIVGTSAGLRELGKILIQASETSDALIFDDHQMYPISIQCDDNAPHLDIQKMLRDGKYDSQKIHDVYTSMCTGLGLMRMLLKDNE